MWNYMAILFESHRAVFITQQLCMGRDEKGYWT